MSNDIQTKTNNKQYFVAIENGGELDNLLDSPTLNDPRFLIKTYNEDGTCNLVPIVNIKDYQASDVLPFAQKIAGKNKGYEVVFNISEFVLKDREAEFPEAIELTKTGDNTYLEKRPQMIKQLLEYGAKYFIDDKLLKDCQVVTLVPATRFDNKGFVLSYKRGLINKNDINSATRNAYEQTAYGAGLYLTTDNPHILDDYRNWIAKINQVKAGFYTVSMRNYYYIKKLPETEINNMSTGLAMLYRQMIKDKNPVLYDETTENVSSYEQETYNEGQTYYPVRREEIEPLLRGGIDNNPLKNIIIVFEQQGEEFVKKELTDALDVPRPYIRGLQTPNLEGLNLIKTHSFYEWDPRTPLPRVLTRKGIPFEAIEMNFVNEDNSERVWAPAPKTLMNESKEEFATKLEQKGNKYFILITGAAEEEILEQLLASGQTDRIKEFEVSNRDGQTYYIEKIPVIDKPKPSGTLTT